MDFTSVPANGPFPLFVLDLVEDATLLVGGGTLKLRRVSRESVEYLRQFFFVYFFLKGFLTIFLAFLARCIQP